MAYLVVHHGTYWFQIRVPKALTGRYGTHVRQCLQTTERAAAQALAYQLASHWLSRFAAERSGGEILSSSPEVVVPAAPEERPLSAHVPTPDASDVATASSAATLSRNAEFEDSFVGLRRYWRSLHAECSPSTYREVEAIASDISAVLKKRPSEVGRIDVAIYRDELIARGLAPATVGKKISLIGTLLQTAFDAGVLPSNAARGLRIPKPKVRPRTRRAFDVEELRVLFSSPVYANRRRFRGGGGEAAAWLPLIALATGARLEEIAQLRVTDLVRDESYGPLMHITDEGKDQRLKTSSSRRVIPLHPELVAAGLLDYRDELIEFDHELLFPLLFPDRLGRRGAAWGKWFARYLRGSRGCHILDRRLVFHSLRHTFKTLCREAGVPEEVHDALTGHVSVSVGRGYGYVPLNVLVDAVASVRFPIALPTIEY